MDRTFDLLAGDTPGETTAEAVEAVAESAPDIDLAALVARFNDIDARINALESKLNDAFKSQVESTSDAVEASEEIADDDNPEPETNTDTESEDKTE